jgi:hypothetical protein
MCGTAQAVNISTNSLPDGTVGSAYSVQLQANAGRTPYMWTLTAESRLPPGLTITPGGRISGTPTTAGDYAFTITVVDSRLDTANRSFTIRVLPRPAITTAALPTAVVGAAYSQTIAASGGVPPYTWSLKTGSLPPGLTLNGMMGRIAGTPSTAGSFNFTARVVDSGNADGEKAFTLEVAPALAITTSSLAGGTAGTAYSATLASSGGVTPYAWSVSAGALPGGLTLAPGTGIISGMPTAAGTFNFTARVADQAGASVTRALQIVVALALSISTASPLPQATSGTAYSQDLAATGGSPPYMWSISAGALPGGLTLSAGGRLSGTPTATGDFNFTARVADSANRSATKPLSITVNPAAQAPPLAITTSSLAEGTVGTAYSVTLAASGGMTPYAWAVSAGALPGGLTLAPGTGIISGMPTAAGTFNFTARVADQVDASVTRALQIVVAPALSISTASPLPQATSGTANSQDLAATGGSPPYMWSISAGALPGGLTLSAGGRLSGTPTATGDFNFTARVADSANRSATKPLSITVNPALVISNAPLQAGRVGEAYSRTLTASGGTPPYSWSLASGALPGGLTLSSGGQITGTPIAAGTYNFAVQVADAGGIAVKKDLEITVAAAALTITSSMLPPGTTGVAYSQNLSAAGGRPPYAWSIASGALPAGLVINASTGAIAGTPLQSGQSTLVVRVTDAAAATAERSFSLQVTQGVVLGACPAADGSIGQNYTAALTATGGRTPYVFSVNGQLPPGIGLDGTTGAIAGSPTAAGNFPVIFRVLDAAGQTDSKNCTFSITSPLVISTNILPFGTVGTRYSQTLAGTGGTAPYVWTVVAGSLPPGLTLAPAGDLSGMPSQQGAFNFTVRLTDRTAKFVEKPLAMTIATGVTIATCPTPTAAVGRPYASSVSAVGGQSPFTWRIVAGSLPSSISLSAAGGTFTGTPDQPISSAFTLQVTDAGGSSADRPCTITVANQLMITRSTIPSAAVNSPYSEIVSASGGTAPYSWSSSAGALPPGLALNSVDGRILGSPTQAGTFAFTIRVTDSLAVSADQAFSISVTAGIAISTCPTPVGTAGQSYISSMSVVGGDGPFSWSIAAGSLPEGLTLGASDGTVSGTPAATGSANFTLRVADRSSTAATRACTITVGTPALAISTAEALPDAFLGTPFSHGLAAAGGTQPYTWSLAGGELPPGLQLSSDGMISGQPTAAGPYSFTIRVEDVSKSVIARAFRLRVLPASAPSVSFSGMQEIVGAAQQPRVDFVIAAPYPSEIRGRLLLNFEPDPGLRDDPAIQFATGGRSIEFTIPPNSTTPVYTLPQLTLQTGTIAGTIRLSIRLEADGVDITPSPAPERTMRVDRTAPAISSVRVVTRTGGFELWITGYSTTLDVTSGTFRFSPAAGSSFNNPEVAVQMREPARAWFENSSSVSYGGLFTLVQPFTVQGATVRAVSVTLTNAQGTSQAVDATF